MILWCASSGPDASHLQDVAWFKTKRAASEHCHKLPLSPMGRERDSKIEKFEFKGKGYGRGRAI